MSARDDMDVFLNCQGLSVIDRQKAQWLMSDFAHELAEEIRNSKRLRDYTDDHMSDCNMAADEIDPEVEK